MTANTPDIELDEIFEDYGVLGELKSSDPLRTRDRAWLKNKLIAWSNKRTRDIAEKVIGEDDTKKPEETPDGSYFCDNCDHMYDPEDTDYSSRCWCDHRNILRSEQRQTLNTLLGE